MRKLVVVLVIMIVGCTTESAHFLPHRDLGAYPTQAYAPDEHCEHNGMNDAGRPEGTGTHPYYLDDGTFLMCW